MKRTDFEERVRELEKAKDTAHAKMLIAELRAGADRMPAPLVDRFKQASVHHELSVPSIEPAGLRIGEAWLLLFEAPCNGYAVRLHSDVDGDFRETPLVFEVRRAHRGLVTTAARSCRRLGRTLPPAITVDAPYARFQIEGSSLGLSVAVATLSAALRIPPNDDTAGSARVDENGTLWPIEHLAEKLDALERSWPQVRRVVVARGQPEPTAYRGRLELVEAADLAAATRFFGLDVLRLPVGSVDTFRERVRRFRDDDRTAPDTRDWLRLSLEALEASEALAADDPEASAEAALWGALFAVHAGDPGAADALLARVPEESITDVPELQARALIIKATKRIDEDPTGAAALAKRAVDLCNSLPQRERRELLGRAIGTQGRALMHQGDFVGAEPLLRAGLEHHKSHVQTASEGPRSACYLATCRRLAGHLADALDIVDAAIRLTEQFDSKWDVAAVTRLYLRLERGRICSALGRWDEARAEFEIVRAGQQEDTAYPRLGAMRGLARALRELGRDAEARHALNACIKVACEPTNGSTLRKVAAIAAGEALLASEHAPDLEAAWRAAFGETAVPTAVSARIRGWVY